MFIVGERKLMRLVSRAMAGESGSIEFRRGDSRGKLSVEPYGDVIGVSLNLRHISMMEVEEELYFDLEILKNRHNIIRNFQKELERYYKLCEIGLYVKYGIYENPLPKETTIDEIRDFFNISIEEYNKAEIIDYKYGKVIFSVVGEYFGKKRIHLLYSKKTSLFTNLYKIEEVL